MSRFDVRRAKRREVRRETSDRELIEPLDIDEPAQSVEAEVEETDVGREGASRQRHGRLGQQDLPAVRRGGHPGGPVDVAPHVVVAAGDALARMETNPDAYDRVDRPGLGGERTLHLDGGVDGRRRVSEHDQERVTLGPSLDASERPKADRMIAWCRSSRSR